MIFMHIGGRMCHECMQIHSHALRVYDFLVRRKPTYLSIIMVIHDKTVTVYDIEIFPNCFHCTCKNTETNDLYTFEISERKNQLTELVDFFYYKNKDKM